MRAILTKDNDVVTLVWSFNIAFICVLHVFGHHSLYLHNLIWAISERLAI